METELKTIDKGIIMCTIKRYVLITIQVLFLAVFPVYSETTQENTADEKITLNFQDASVNEVLDYLSETAGLVIVSDVLIDTKINLVSKQPISIDEAVALINTILKENNYAAIRTGRTLKIVQIDQAKQMNIPVTSGSDPDKIEPTDEIVTHIIPIRYADATKLREDISSLVPTYAVLSSNEASNSLIITDTKANIKRLVEIVQAVDTQMGANADVKVFHLIYADAKNVAELINNVFEQEESQQSDALNPFARMRGFFRGGPGGGNENAAQSGTTGGIKMKVVAAADEKTNTVVVSGPADTLEVVAKVVKDLDSNPDEERRIFVFPLKNAQAENLKEVLNNLFQELQQINQSTSVSGTGQSRRAVTNQPNASSGTSSDISEEVYIEADLDTNALLIMTSSKNYEKIKPIIDDLDKPVPQVLIKVLIVEVTTSNDFDFGTEFSFLNIKSDDRRSLVNTEFIGATETTGFIAKLTQSDFEFTLRALEEVGKLNVLSRPYILTSNNQTATITVGKEVPFIRDTRTTETGQTINTIEYEDIGIILEVTPNINQDGLVIMDVRPEISTTTAETVPISETVDAAVFAKRSSQSRVAVLNGQTIVIGGLMEDQEKETVKKVPLVGDIPVVGNLFKRTIREKEKTELLIFLTPQVAGSNEELAEISEHERSKSPILNDVNENQELKGHIENMESTVRVDIH